MRGSVVVIFRSFVFQMLLLSFSWDITAEIVEKAVTLQEKTPIEIRLKETCSSKHVNVGQVVPFETTTEVKVDNEIVIKKGSSVTGRVLKAKPSSCFGQSGELTIGVEHVISVDGQQVPLLVNFPHQGKDYILATTFLGYCCCPLIWLYEGKEAECVQGTT